MAERRSEFAEFVAEQLRALGPLAIDRFFGGLGIKSGSFLFAMIMDGLLYFAVDEPLREEFERRGSQCFSFASKKGRIYVKRFYEVPADVLEDPAQLVDFARKSIIAAEARAAAKRMGTGSAKKSRDVATRASRKPRAKRDSP